MDAIRSREIAELCLGDLVCGSGDEIVTGVVTDSRKAGKDDLFVCLEGERVDGHDFIGDVIDKGTRCILVSRKDAVPNDVDLDVILVEDTLAALQRFAGKYLDSLGLKKIAVTGSVGKTSTRDMLYHICSEKYKTGKPIANYNSDVGVPLTIFTFDSSMEACVLEHGMENRGEIHRLVKMTRPDAAVITNIGVSHIERLGSRQDIMDAKMEIVDYFGKENTLIINACDDMLRKIDPKDAYGILRVGSEDDEDYIVSDIEDKGDLGIGFTLSCDGRSYDISLSVPGAHNAINAGLAIAAAKTIGIDTETSIRGLAHLTLTGKRLVTGENAGIKVIDDSYNASPDSMRSAINTLANTKGERKIAVLGDMNELGEISESSHRDIGKFVAENGIDMLITVGEKARDMADAAEEAGLSAVRRYDDADSVTEECNMIFRNGDAVLVKASNSLNLGMIADKLLKKDEGMS